MLINHPEIQDLNTNNMKKFMIFASVLLLIASCKKDKGDQDGCNYSYIIAGDSLSSCYEVIGSDSFSPYPYYTCEFDLDNNDSIDLTLRSYRHSASHGTYLNTGCYVMINNPLLELSAEKVPVLLNSDFVFLHRPMDTIGDNEKWLGFDASRLDISNIVIFYHHDPWTGHVTTRVRDSVNVNFSHKYIGVRIKKPSFTSYYWIKLSVRDSENLYIEGFGRPGL